jgi:MATE family multidrug resistance protein
VTIGDEDEERLQPMMGRTKGPGAPPRTLLEQAWQTLRLAGPVMVARAGLLIMVAVDTAMVGHAGPLELAYFGLGQALTIPLFVVGIGMLQGVAVLSAQSVGAGVPHECGAIWRTGMIFACVAGVLVGLLSLLGEPFLLLTGQSPDLARGGGVVTAAYSWNIAALLLYVATSAFLESINKPMPGMIVMLVANVANALFNWLLIFGHGGFPAMGAEGAAVATGIARWLAFAVLAAYALTMADAAKFGVRGALETPSRWGRRIWRMGLPLGVAQGAESTAFMSMSLMAGLLGAVVLSGYQIAFNLIALVFMLALGLATATAVWVGQAVGRNDPKGVALAGWTGVGLVALLLGACALLFTAVPDLLVAVYSSDHGVMSAAVAAVGVAAGFLIFDGAQAVLMGALRGIGDVWVPLSLQLMSFWLIAVPMAALLGFTADWGVRGLMGGIFIGLVNASLVLGWRFHVVSKRDIRRF